MTQQACHTHAVCSNSRPEAISVAHTTVQPVRRIRGSLFTMAQESHDKNNTIHATETQFPSTAPNKAHKCPHPRPPHLGPCEPSCHIPHAFAYPLHALCCCTLQSSASRFNRKHCGFSTLTRSTARSPQLINDTGLDLTTHLKPWRQASHSDMQGCAAARTHRSSAHTYKRQLQNACVSCQDPLRTRTI